MDTTKTKWDLFIILLAIYTSVCLPLELAVLPPFLDNNIYFEVCNHVITFLYIIDIVISFRTSYVNPMMGDEVFDTKKISINYIQGRFWPDIISTIPFDIIF